MDEMNGPACAAQGRLTDADAIKLANMACMDEAVGRGSQALTCTLPEGHGNPHHIALIATQSFGADDQWPKIWWGSWRDEEELRDEAALFQGPTCNALWVPEGREPDSPLTCTLLSGHIWDEGDRHMWA